MCRSTPGMQNAATAAPAHPVFSTTSSAVRTTQSAPAAALEGRGRALAAQRRHPTRRARPAAGQRAAASSCAAGSPSFSSQLAATNPAPRALLSALPVGRSSPRPARRCRRSERRAVRCLPRARRRPRPAPAPCRSRPCQRIAHDQRPPPAAEARPDPGWEPFRARPRAQPPCARPRGSSRARPP